MIEPHVIWHSGYFFVSYDRGPNGPPVWPIEEYLVRSTHPWDEQHRIRALNPHGQEEGTLPVLPDGVTPRPRKVP